MSDSPFQAFIAPARVHPQLWRLLFGIVVLMAVFIGCIFILLGVVWLIVGDDSALLWLDKMQGAVTPTSTLLLFATFIGLALGAFAAARLLHERRPATLFGPRARVIPDFFKAALCVLVIYAVSLVIWTRNFDAIPNLDLSLWLSFLPLALIGLLVQTGAEELVFRGYIQQQLAARFASPLIWMVLPSILFGLVHLDPGTAGDNAWIVVAAATFFGLVAADLTARTGSIGAAWGFHFANNLLAITVLATDGTITGLALYLTPYTADQVSGVILLSDIVITALAWGACRLVLRVPSNSAPIQE